MLALSARFVFLGTLLGALAWGMLGVSGRTASPGDDVRLTDLPADAATARQGVFETSLKSTGRLAASRTVSVVSPDFEGKVIFIAEDGAPVKKGDVICRFDDTEFRRELRQETLEYENAKAELAKSKADRSLENRNSDATVKKLEEELRILKESNEQLLKQARAQLAFDEANLKRSQTELERKKRQAEERLIPKEQVELAEIDERAKEFAVDKGQKELKLQEDKAASTERQKQIELENARVTAQTAQRKTGDESTSLQRRLRHREREVEEEREKVEKCVLRATATGMLVLNRLWQRVEQGVRATRVGYTVWTRRQLAEIPDLSRMIVSCRIPERDIGGVRVGAAARVRLEEDASRLYRATVSRISSAAEEVDPWDSSDLEPGTRTFTVTLDLHVRDTKRLFPGMTSNVEIVTRQLPQTLYVPKQCVFERGEGHVVYRWKPMPPGRKGRFVATPVVPGLENERHVVIKKGLKPGDRLAKKEPV
jgi:multidrug efflux pump subunit AcrA (membrane-fusion protein)